MGTAVSNGRRRVFASRLIVGGAAIVILAPLGVLVGDHGRETVNVSRAHARGRLVAELKDSEGERPDQPQEALDFYWLKRSPTGAPLPADPLQAAAAAADQLPLYSTLTHQVSPGGTHAPTVPLTPVTATGSATGAFTAAWQPLGPGNVGGRSRALLIHKTQNNLMWTAGVAGGIWKSTDGGASWQPKGDLLVNIAVNSIIQDQKDPAVLYAGTGEGYFNGDGVRGQGIFKSTDYGETWAQLPATNNSNFFYVQKLAATSQKNKQRIYAATRTGIFRSSDDGATWAKVLDATSVNGCMDLVMQYDDQATKGYIYASCGTFAQATVWRAPDTDQGQVWQPVLSEPNMGRTSLAVSRSNPNVVYAMASFYDVAKANAQDYALLAIFRSTQAGAPGSWDARVQYTDPNPINTVQLTNPVYAFLHDCGFGPDNLPIYTQGWYDNQIAVDPQNENIVWSAGIDLMRSDDGGKTWGVGSYWWFDPTDPDYAHADNHVITFHPKYNGVSNRQMFVGSDGGVFRTDNARAAVGKTLTSICGSPARNEVHWTSLNNGYQVTQFYHGAVYPDGTTYFGGAQDNGTVRGNTAGGQQWETISGGDGGYVAVDRDDTSVLFSEFTGKSLQRSLNGGTSWTDIYAGVREADGNFLFIEPFAMDPTHSPRLWYGGAFAWRSDDRGSHWTPVSQFLSARIASWAVAPTDPNRVYLGVQHIGTTTSGRIFTTTEGTTAAGQVFWPSAQPRQGYVSAIAVDPAVSTTAYATYSTYNFGSQAGHVFKTTDGGVTWTRIDLSLPDVPVNTIAVHPTQPDTLYIGTDLGVFVTLDGGATWMRENTGFANVVVDHLEVSNQRLFAFTHGRSAWSVPLAN